MEFTNVFHGFCGASVQADFQQLLILRFKCVVDLRDESHAKNTITLF